MTLHYMFLIVVHILAFAAGWALYDFIKLLVRLGRYGRG
jgi:hypothetical protein